MVLSGRVTFERGRRERPFSANNAVEILHQHCVNQPPHPGHYVSDSPVEVSNAILRALSKSPEQRFPSCTAFAVAFGCNLLHRPADGFCVFREAVVAIRRQRGSRTGYVYLSRRARTVVIISAQGTLYEADDMGIRRWPWPAIREVRRNGNRLLVRTAEKHQLTSRTYCFSSRDEADDWEHHLRGVSVPSQDEDKSVCEDAELPPIPLLTRRPRLQFQDLGLLQAEGVKWIARATIRILLPLVHEPSR